MLPPELRNIIYEGLFKTTDIIIHSPCKRRGRQNQAVGVSTTGILRVNWQTRWEASRIFFRKVWFTLGNGHYGSTTLCNLQGLKAFVSRVPAPRVALIRHAILDLHVARDKLASTRVPPHPWFCFPSRGVAEQAKSVCRILQKSFTGLRRITVRCTGSFKYSGALSMQDTQLVIAEVLQKYVVQGSKIRSIYLDKIVEFVGPLEQVNSEWAIVFTHGISTEVAQKEEDVGGNLITIDSSGDDHGLMW